MKKWGYQKESDILCEYGEDQSDDHLLQCTLAPPGCTTDDLVLANEKAISIATHRLKQNINTYLFIHFIFCIYILTYLLTYC